jgi:rubrerythrin
VTDLTQVLRHAMLSERDGYQFYSMAAEGADDPKAAEMFRHLAREELRHYDALQHKYRGVLEGAPWDEDAAWGAPWEPEESERIFSDGFRRRIQGRHLEMAAISIGLLLEKEAFQFYTNQADEAEDQVISAFFRELAAWEDGHYRMLLREDEALKDDYWAENRFEPLD